MEIEAVRNQPRRHCVTLIVSGEVDHEHWEEFRAAMLAGAWPSGTTAVVLDLSRVDFFDSGGVRALVSARKALEMEGVTLHVDARSSPVQQLLETTGLDAFLPPLPA